jgi:hypothetical protein
LEGQDGEWTVTLSKRTRRSISLENGLRRALLGLLPLPAPFEPMIFGRLERPSLLIRKVRTSVEPSAGAPTRFLPRLRDGLGRKKSKFGVATGLGCSFVALFF